MPIIDEWIGTLDGSTVDPIKLVFSVSEKDYLEAADRIRAILAKPPRPA
jgi:hypothetical protein